MENQLISNTLLQVRASLVTLLLVFFAGISNGIMDTLQFHYGKSIFHDDSKFEQQYWKPDISWKNKYKEYPKDKNPKFPGSTTLFVWLTDGWHFFQAIMLFCFFLAVISYKRHQTLIINLIILILLFVCFSIGFTLMYDFILAISN